MGLDARQPKLHQLSRPGRRLARLAGWVCTHRFPATPTQRAGGPTPGRPRLTVPRVSEWEGGGVSAGAGTEQIPQKAKRGEGGAAVGTDQTRAGSPCLVREQPPGAPDTPTAPAARASPPGRPEGDGEAGSGRAGSGDPRGKAEASARRGRLCSPGGRCPGAASGCLASPPRGSRRRAAPSPPHGRPPPPPPPRARPARLPLRRGSASGCAGGQRLGRARRALARSLRSGEPGSALPPSLLPPPLTASCCHLEPLLPPPGGRLGKHRPSTHPHVAEGPLLVPLSPVCPENRHHPLGGQSRPRKPGRSVARVEGRGARAGQIRGKRGETRRASGTKT